MKNFFIILSITLSLGFYQTVFADVNFSEDFTGFSSPLNTNTFWTDSSSAWTLTGDSITVPSSVSTGWQTAVWNFTSDFNLAEEGYFSFRFFADSSNNVESNIFFYIYGVNPSSMARTKIMFGADADSNRFKIYGSGNDTNPQSYSEDEWHTLKCSYWHNTDTGKYDYKISIDDGAWSDTFTDNRSYSATNMNNFGIARYYPSDFKFDDFYISDVAPDDSDSDALAMGDRYSSDLNYFLSYVSPKEYDEEEALSSGFYSVTVKPDPDFSSLWYAGFESGLNEVTKIQTNKCDSNFQNCTAEILPNQTSFLNSLEDLKPNGIDISQKKLNKDKVSQKSVSEY